MSSSPTPLTQRARRRACSRSRTSSCSLGPSGKAASSLLKVVRSLGYTGFDPWSSCSSFQSHPKFQILIVCRLLRALTAFTLWLTPLAAENQWLHLPLITKLKKDCKEVFPNVEYAYTTIPTYPSGQIGFMVCSKDATRDLANPLRSFTPEEEEKLCRYYNKEIHKASFVLPTFARAALR